MNILDHLHPHTSFDETADLLLNHYLLKTGNRQYRMAEVEFYLHAPHHPDPFAHRHPVQVYPGGWYFHRIGSKHGSYKGGSYKGIDVTFGAEPDSYGGILIRAIQDTADESDYIYGPSLTVDRLLQDTGYADVRTLDANLGNALDESKPLYFVRAALPQFPVYDTWRVGLPFKEVEKEDAAHPKQEFFSKPYRYFIYPEKKHAGKKATAAIWLREGKYTREEINSIFKRKII